MDNIFAFIGYGLTVGFAWLAVTAVFGAISQRQRKTKQRRKDAQ